MSGGGGDGGGGEELAVERQLEQHLEEQKESLEAVNEALVSDTSNPELLAIHQELVLAIKDAGEGLLHLKRARLLKEADSIFLRQKPEPVIPDVKPEPLDPGLAEPEPLELGNYSVGSKCRFRYTDGRWYNGHIMGLEDACSARISFLTPTSESMLICKFFLQQRCRFGSNCRMSHGFVVPTSSLKQYIPTVWQQSMVGSSIWATSENHYGIWRKAELEFWDDELSLGQVVFQDDGSSARLGCDAFCISEYAEMSENEEEDELISEEFDSSYEEEDLGNDAGNQGLGFLELMALQRGVQTDAVIFAKWENHTRGIASRMMANMGYCQGMGLGISGQGITDPVSVKAHSGKKSLDHAVASNKAEGDSAGRGKKRSRGGKRKREKKFAEATRSAKAKEEQVSDVFSFINRQLHAQDVVEELTCKPKRVPGEVVMRTRKEDRRSLVAYDDEVRELRNRVDKLEEMVSRNRKDKAVFEAASRKLIETRKALSDVEAAHASASNAVVSKEKEKKWLKF